MSAAPVAEPEPGPRPRLCAFVTVAFGPEQKITHVQVP